MVHKAVRERAGWRCEICGCSTAIQAHHLMTRGSHPEHRLDVNVGVAVCDWHHRWFEWDKRGGLSFLLVKFRDPARLRFVNMAWDTLRPEGE